jgi:hypothetical protein
MSYKVIQLPSSLIHRALADILRKIHDDKILLHTYYAYRIKDILFSILSLSGPLYGEPDRVSQMMVLIKTVSNTNSPLFCVSVIYIQKSLKRWKKYFLQLQKRFRI